MANWDSMTLWSDNNAKFEKLMKKLKPQVRYINFDVVEEGKKLTAYIKASPIPDDEVKKLSAENPGMMFYAECSFEADLNLRVYKIQYKKGESKVIGFSLGYMWPSIQNNICPQEQINKLQEMVCDVFQRIDQVGFNDEGGIEKIYPFDVMVSAENDGFKMQATKSGEQVFEVKIFKKCEKIVTTWDEIKDKTDDTDDVPF